MFEGGKGAIAEGFGGLDEHRHLTAAASRDWSCNITD